MSKNLVFASVLGLSLLAGPARADDAIDLDVAIDARKADNRANNATLRKLDKLANHSLVCLNIAVTTDGSQQAAILTATEGDRRRYPVDCRKGQLGSFPMAGGIEYYLPNIGTFGGAEVDLEIYPGTRTVHPFNDVDCEDSNQPAPAATFRIVGFYTVRSHDFGSRRVVEFRPAPVGGGVSREAAVKCLN